MNVFDSIPDGFFNCLASSSNHRAYAGCLGAIYEQYSSAVSYRLPRTDIRDSLVIYLLQNHIELKEDGTEDLVTGNDQANFIIRKFVASGYIEEETDDITFEKYIVSKIRTFEITDKKIMTVENLTSFNRIKKSDTFFIFLSGYHNSAKQAFLTKIFSQNSNKEYYHFGDIDPDGFFILDNLRSKTQIDFKSYKMNCQHIFRQFF